MVEDFASLPDDPRDLFSQVGRKLLEEGDLHRLFDLRILQSRFELGLPVELYAPLEGDEESYSAQLEAAYLDACREVGQLLLDANRPAEAWRYLRPTGEKQAFRSWLSRALPEESNADELIELALHEGIDPERGFAWQLARRGTCQAVTELEAMQGHLSLADQRACTAVLIRHVHEELHRGVQTTLQQLDTPVDSTHNLAQLLAAHAELLRQQAPLIDVSHLTATVRFAELLADTELLQLAVDLSEYGLLLAEDFFTPEPPPFEDFFGTHRLLFRATQGHEVEEALDFFGRKAREVSADAQEVTAIEVYLALLQRTGRAEQALIEYADLVAEDCALSDFAPSLLNLASGSENWQAYFEICRSRNDILSFVAGKLAQRSGR